MLKAILYIRVSTDEQADKGYSQRSQEEVLKKYCQGKGISITEILFEDHSAKTFKRPRWAHMLHLIRRQKRYRPDLVLFTKWDRFSRNTSEAYQMIAYLRKFGIEPQAIEQPLDLTVPENKMMLAFYLAVPEVENERRGLNIFFGLRRARKEGRWTTAAPVGYLNKTAENGTKLICPDPIQGKLMAQAFEDLATGNHAIDQIWRKAVKHGLKCGKSNFSQIIRNPIYCGLITVPAHKDEILQFVQGQHTPIISRELFEKVQIVLGGDKKTKRGKLNGKEDLFLRGHLCCPKCSRMLTGSSSKGRKSYYLYYHCSSKCGVRFPALKVNDEFITYLAAFKLDEDLTELFLAILKDRIYVGNDKLSYQQQELLKQLQQTNERLEKSRDLLVDGLIEAEDFQEIKKRHQGQALKLQKSLEELQWKQRAIDSLVPNKKTFSLQMSALLSNSTIEYKKRLLQLFIPQFLTYETNGFREITLAKELLFLLKNIAI